MGKLEAKKLHTFLGHNDSLYSLEALDEYRFFSAGSDGMVVMWNLKSPDEGEVVARVDGSVYSMAFDPVEGALFVGENNSGIHKIDLEKRKEIASIQMGDHQIYDVRVSGDTIWLALESGEVAKLTNELKVLDRQKFSSKRARSIDFVDGMVAVGFSDHLTRIIDSEKMELLSELKGHQNSIFSAKYHPSGKYLVSGGRDASIKVWDTSSDYQLREDIAAHLYTVNHIVHRNDGRIFATASMDKTIKIWNAHNFKLLKVLDKQRHEGHKNSVNKLLWMKYQDLLVSCSDDRSISVWDIKLEE